MIARRIASDLNSEANFAGDLQLVYDADGRRVGCFPGGNALVHLWSEWRPGWYKVFTGGNGRRFTEDYVAWMLGEDEDDCQGKEG